MNFITSDKILMLSLLSYGSLSHSWTIAWKISPAEPRKFIPVTYLYNMKGDSKKLNISQIGISDQPSLLSTIKKLDSKTDCRFGVRNSMQIWQKLSFETVRTLGVCLHEHTHHLQEGLRYNCKLASMLSEVKQMVEFWDVANEFDVDVPLHCDKFL